MFEDIYAACDSEEVRGALAKAAPWTKDRRCFTKIRISALAMAKMTLHAEEGGDIEVMGLMQGKVRDSTIIVTDAFALPVEGTETRVNAGAAANEFMVAYTETNEKMLSDDYVLGWYHSHPGYGCWLSGIDVQTQSLYQQHQEPFVAVVIDPKKTVKQGKVEIGAFRTLQVEQRPVTQTGAIQAKGIPAEKFDDFGMHASHYYPLQVEVFKTEVDDSLLGPLMKDNWIDVLSDSPLETNINLVNSEISCIVKELDTMSKDYSKVTPANLRACCGRTCSLAHEAMYDIALRAAKRSLIHHMDTTSS